MSIKFLDAHTHTQFAAYDADREEVLKRAGLSRVGMINVGTQKKTSKEAVHLAEKKENLWATVGLHPTYAGGCFYYDTQELGPRPFVVSESAEDKIFCEDFDYNFYKKLASSPKVVAIGECGLDYFRIKNDELGIKEGQKAAFLQQIKLAHEVGKPLMIHCRSAFPDLIETLIHNSKFLIPDRPGVVHFFSGKENEAEKLLEMGFCFTFGGVITFARDYDEVIDMIPTDKILSETDAPYVTPAPYRGKRNEPSYVIEVVKKLAEIKRVGIDQMATQILKNAERVFGITFSKP